MNTQAALTAAIVAMDRAAHDLADAVQAFEAAHRIARREAYQSTRGVTALEELLNGPIGCSTLRTELAAHLSALGLGPVVAGAVIPDTSGAFLTRWQTRIAHLVP